MHAQLCSDDHTWSIAYIYIIFLLLLLHTDVQLTSVNGKRQIHICYTSIYIYI